jgi:hypothetical protein
MMQRRLRLQDELQAAEEAEMLEAGYVDVEVVFPETIQPMETENESAAMDRQVARERTVADLNISNPIAASQSAVADQAYQHIPDVDADADV